MKLSRVGASREDSFAARRVGNREGTLCFAGGCDRDSAHTQIERVVTEIVEHRRPRGVNEHGMYVQLCGQLMRVVVIRSVYWAIPFQTEWRIVTGGTHTQHSAGSNPL